MPYKKILTGTDGSDTATRALADAVHLAKANGAEIVVLTVFDPPSPDKLRAQMAQAPPEVSWRITGSGAAEEIVDKATSFVEGEGVSAKGRVEPGDPADVIIRVAEQEGCDLIIIGNKGMTGAARFLMGSVPNRVSHHSPCDVLIAKTT